MCIMWVLHVLWLLFSPSRAGKVLEVCLGNISVRHPEALKLLGRLQATLNRMASASHRESSYRLGIGLVRDPSATEKTDQLAPARKAFIPMSNPLAPSS